MKIDQLKLTLQLDYSCEHATNINDLHTRHVGCKLPGVFLCVNKKQSYTYMTLFVKSLFLEK